MSSPWRYMSTDDDRALGKDANHVLWPWARRFSRMFDAVRRPRDAARAPRRAPRPRRTISATEAHITAKIRSTSPQKYLI